MMAWWWFAMVKYLKKSPEKNPSQDGKNLPSSRVNEGSSYAGEYGLWKRL